MWEDCNYVHSIDYRNIKGDENGRDGVDCKRDALGSWRLCGSNCAQRHRTFNAAYFSYVLAFSLLLILSSSSVSFQSPSRSLSPSHSSLIPKTLSIWMSLRVPSHFLPSLFLTLFFSTLFFLLLQLLPLLVFESARRFESLRRFDQDKYARWWNETTARARRPFGEKEKKTKTCSESFTKCTSLECFCSLGPRVQKLFARATTFFSRHFWTFKHTKNFC